MDTVSRNPTVRFSRIAAEYSYEGGDDVARSETGHQNNGWRIFSTRRSHQTLMSSWSYRRDRARKRLIFLQTYKLGSTSSRDHKFMRSTRKLKKMVVKAKSAVVSVLAFMRGGALKSCNSRPAISASSPSRVVKFC